MYYKFNLYGSCALLLGIRRGRFELVIALVQEQRHDFLIAHVLLGTVIAFGADLAFASRARVCNCRMHHAACQLHRAKALVGSAQQNTGLGWAHTHIIIHDRSRNRCALGWWWR
jgi:hypothetical protein